MAFPIAAPFLHACLKKARAHCYYHRRWALPLVLLQHDIATPCIFVCASICPDTPLAAICRPAAATESTARFHKLVQAIIIFYPAMAFLMLGLPSCDLVLRRFMYFRLLSLRVLLDWKVRATGRRGGIKCCIFQVEKTLAPICECLGTLRRRCCQTLRCGWGAVGIGACCQTAAFQRRFAFAARPLWRCALLRLSCPNDVT